MPLGYALLGFALVVTVAANVLYATARGREQFVRWAGQCVALAAAGVVGASVYLMTLIAGHHFEVAYVAEYSATRSSSWYLFAAFWGGQEGSILLWTFWTAVLGVILSRKAGDKVAKVWPLYGIIQIYLLGLLLLKCPFAMGSGPVPDDGKGLNPLLENYWMVIHPPILFLGFASTLPPAVWTMYGLIHRDWDGWARAAFSWTLFSFAALGLGLSLGGYWAYETLGWGGFWAWDPVENTSLVPWLFLIALLHGLPSQLRTGALRRSNLLVGFLPFATMSYGTFLTRTGVLGDFSFHSFSSLGRDGFNIMLCAVLASTFVPLGYWIARLRQIPSVPAATQMISRAAGFALATSLLGLLGLFVGIGMSAPLISKLWTAKGASMPQNYYNLVTYPFGGLLLTLTMAVTPYVAWKSDESGAVGKRVFKAYIAALIATAAMLAIAFYLGVRKPAMVALFAASIFTVFANFQMAFPRLKHASSRKTIGGFVAHMGGGLTIAGIAILVAFSQVHEHVLLLKNAPREVMGYKMTYVGMTSHPYDRDHNSIRIRMEKPGEKAWEARPRFYFAPWESKDTVFGNPPAIQRGLGGDLYIASNSSPLSFYLAFTASDEKGIRYAPENIDAADAAYIESALGPNALSLPSALSPNAGFALQKGQPQTFGEYTFTLIDHELDERLVEAKRTGGDAAMEALAKSLPFYRIRARVHVVYQGQEIELRPALRFHRDHGIYSEPAILPGGNPSSPALLRFAPPRPEETDPAFNVFETYSVPDPTEAVFIDISTKPMIWFVWAGTLLFTIGGLIAYRRRALEAMSGKAVSDADSAP